MPRTKVVEPPKRSLAGVLAKFAMFSPDFMSEGRGEHRQKKRKAAQAHTMTLLPGKMNP
jgi:hypothetical protein